MEKRSRLSDCGFEHIMRYIKEGKVSKLINVFNHHCKYSHYNVDIMLYLSTEKWLEIITVILTHSYYEYGDKKKILKSLGNVIKFKPELFNLETLETHDLNLVISSGIIENLDQFILEYYNYDLESELLQNYLNKNDISYCTRYDSDKRESNILTNIFESSYEYKYAIIESLINDFNYKICNLRVNNLENLEDYNIIVELGYKFNNIDLRHIRFNSCKTDNLELFKLVCFEGKIDFHKIITCCYKNNSNNILTFIVNNFEFDDFVVYLLDYKKKEPIFYKLVRLGLHIEDIYKRVKPTLVNEKIIRVFEVNIGYKKFCTI